jgi:hypothetical protein
MDATQKQILKKMLQKNIIGKRHSLAETLKHSIARDKRGNFDNATKKLVKHGYITMHPTRHGNAFAIAPCQVAEIQKLLDL